MAVFLGVFGAVIGSFLNVVIYRVPAKKSIVSPPSACGNCGHHIRGYDNIPLISWVLLRGRCRDCGTRISVRYPLVELGTALFFAAVALWGIPQVLAAGSELRALGLGVELVAFLYLAAISVALAMIDIDVHKLPNSIVLPAYGVGAILLGTSAILTGSYAALVTAAIGGAVLFALYFALFFFVPGGMGFGDVKLAGVLGLFLGYLGWGPLVVGALGAFLLGGIFSIALLVSRRGTGKSKVPFGPWMLAGAWLGVFAGAPVALWYLSFFGVGGS